MENTKTNEVIKLESAVDTIQEKVENTVEQVTDVVDTIQEKVENTVEEIEKVIEEGTDRIEDAADTIKVKSANKIQETFKKIIKLLTKTCLNPSNQTVDSQTQIPESFESDTTKESKVEEKV